MSKVVRDYLEHVTKLIHEHMMYNATHPPMRQWFKLRAPIMDVQEYADLIWEDGVHNTRTAYTFVSTEPGSVNYG